MGYLLATIAIGELIFGLYFILKSNYRQSAWWLGLFMISTSIYVAGNAFGYLNFWTSDLNEQIAWSGGILATASFLPFSFSYPYQKHAFSEMLILILWPAVIFIPGIFFSNSFLRLNADVSFGAGYRTASGELFFLVLIFFASYWFIGIYELARLLLKSDGSIRMNTKIMLAGILTSLAIVSFFDIYLPLKTVTSLGFLGSLATSIWLGATTYIITSKK